METTETHFSSQLRGTLLVTLSGLLYGFMGYFGTQLLHEHFSVFSMLFWRFFIAMLWVLATALWMRKNIFKNLGKRSTLIRTLLLSAASYSGAPACFFLASQYTGTGVAMVIFFCFPVFVTLFAWATTNWQMNRFAASSLFAIILGLILLKGHGSHALNLSGIFLAILSGLSYAVYVFSSKYNSKQNIDSHLLTFLVCFGSSLIFLLISCATNTFNVPHSWHAWVYTCTLGIVVTGIPIQLLLDGIKHVSHIKASILSVLEPVVTLLVGVALLNESMSSVQAVGVMVVLLGAILIQFERQ
ncbi:MAG: DMT family transporter [Gammaproteobacteria bacterium]